MPSSTKQQQGTPRQCRSHQSQGLGVGGAKGQVPEEVLSGSGTLASQCYQYDPTEWIQQAAGMSYQGLCANVLTPGKVKGMLMALL